MRGGVRRKGCDEGGVIGKSVCSRDSMERASSSNPPLPDVKEKGSG